MDADRDFGREQRRVAAMMVAGLAITAVVLGAAVASDHATAPLPFAERLRHALAVDLIVAAWLAAGIADVARRRFFSPRDIDGGGGGPPSTAVRRANAILQNTLEQTILAIAAHLTVAAALDRSGTLVTALAGLFATGRLLFWIGYRQGAGARALGFALTFYPSVGALVIAAAASLG